VSVFGLFGTCLVPVWYRFVSISIGIFPYVFLPQTSFLNQKRRKVSFSDFLNFVISHLPGVHVDKKGNIQGLSTIDYPLTTVFLNEANFDSDNSRLCYLADHARFLCGRKVSIRHSNEPKYQSRQSWSA
jgi:hypothetical protein